DNHVLPFNANTVRNVVVIGNATQAYAQQAVAGGVLVGQPMGSGGGSSDVVPNYTVSPIDALKSVLYALGNSAAIVTLVPVNDDDSKADDCEDRTGPEGQCRCGDGPRAFGSRRPGYSGSLVPGTGGWPHRRRPAVRGGESVR